jgi:hypothetical protein
MLVKSGFEKLRALQAAEKLHFWGFVTGHDFSRADKANEINRALAPAEVPWAKFLEIKPFSAACLAPKEYCTLHHQEGCSKLAESG